MNGAMFLWGAWGVWIFATFLLEKGRLRFWTAVWSLIIVIFSPYNIQMNSLTINISFLILILLGVSLFTVNKKREVLFYVLTSLIVSMCYVLYHIYLIYDPAIQLILKPWMFLLMIVGINRILVIPLRLRVSTLIIGLIHGEIIRVLIFIHFIHTLGTKSFLDHLSFTLSVTFIGMGFERVLQIFQELVNKQIGRKITK